LISFSRAWRSSSLKLSTGGFGPGMSSTSHPQDLHILTDLASFVEPGHHLSPNALAAALRTAAHAERPVTAYPSTSAR
jgi:hypothetical protein